MNTSIGRKWSTSHLLQPQAEALANDDDFVSIKPYKRNLNDRRSSRFPDVEGKRFPGTIGSDQKEAIDELSGSGVLFRKPLDWPERNIVFSDRPLCTVGAQKEFHVTAGKDYPKFGLRALNRCRRRRP